jgi:uncharacterized tellurite resistance protein B-like protein
MLDSIRAFFEKSMVPSGSTTTQGLERSRDIRMAACALLLELAHADRDFNEDERKHLRAAIQRHYGLDKSEADQLIGLAEEERAEAIDLWQFTRLINENYSPGQKMVLAEVMWGLVYADGTLGDREEILIRKISDLLDIKPGFLTEIRNRSLLGLEGAQDG